jgi:type I restriction enzyme R subunit
MVHDIFNPIKGSSDDEVYLQFLGDDPTREVFYKSMNAFIKNLNECFVLQDFVHEFKHLDLYKRELKKFMELRKSASLQYADRVDLTEYKQSLVNILDKYVDARGVELLTKQINITDRKQFEEAVENLGSDKSKAEAIAAQTEKTIKEKLNSDPEFYERFSRKITEIIEKMRQGKLADIEALKQLKMIRDHVIDKKDDELPVRIEEHQGSDVLYRNLKPLFAKHQIGESEYEEIVLDIFAILHRETIVDWYKNIDVKRKMMNILDDYLYDIVKTQRDIDLDSDEISTIITTIMQLSENNFEIFQP